MSGDNVCWPDIYSVVLYPHPTLSLRTPTSIQIILCRPVKIFLARYEQLKIASRDLLKKTKKNQDQDRTVYIDSSGKFLKKFKGTCSHYNNNCYWTPTQRKEPFWILLWQWSLIFPNLDHLSLGSMKEMFWFSLLIHTNFITNKLYINISTDETPSEIVSAQNKVIPAKWWFDKVGYYRISISI